MNKRHKLMSLVMLLLLYIMFPLNAFAYSDYILAGGANIGIQINSNGILIVGTYKIGDEDPARDADLVVGDKIIAINNKSVTSINEMLDIINALKDKEELTISFIRNNKEKQTRFAK